MSKYGKSTEVANAHIQNIMSLNSVNLYKKHEFTEKLLRNVQTLRTAQKMKFSIKNFLS